MKTRNNPMESLDQLVLQGIQEHQQGNLKKAYDIYQQALALNPSHTRALNSLGILLFQQGSLSDAKRTLLKAVKENPNLPDTYNNLGVIYKAEGELDEAQTNFEKSIALNSNYVQAFNNLGNLFQEKKEYLKAQGFYEKVITLHPNHYKAWNNLGNSYQSLNNFESAEKAYTKALSIHPQFCECLLNLGYIYQQKKEGKKSIDCYRKAIEIDPSCAYAHYTLGTLYKEYGENDRAIESFEKTLQLKPDHFGAEHLLNALKGKTTESTPKSYIKELYDAFAKNFDTQLVDQLSYCVPQQLYDSIEKLFPNKKEWKCLDLGCGTGLCGELFRSTCSTMIGTDLSEAMVKKAEEKKLYDELTVSDITDQNPDWNGSFDLALAGDVLIYLGNLEKLFKAVTSYLTEEGVFAFSIEKGDTHPYELNRSGRYAHTEEYIKQLASKYRFTVRDCKECIGRKEKSEDVAHLLFILEK